MKLDNFQDLGRMLKVDKTPKKAGKPQKNRVMADNDEYLTCDWNRLRLRRKVTIKCWRVIGTISKAKKREELLPILRHARDMGETSAKDIAEHLYFEPHSRRRVAERLLQIAQRYGLLERDDQGCRLTEAGNDALDKKEVFVPQKGAWTIWASNDPLFADKVLKVEPWDEPSAYSETSSKSKKREERTFDDLPSWLHQVEGDLLATVGAGDVRLEELQPIAERVADIDADLRLDWRLSKGDLRLLGRLDGEDVNFMLPAPDIEQNDIWQQLLTQEMLWGVWDVERSLLRTTFSDTLENERNVMRREIAFHSPMVSGAGRFDDITVSVPLGAQTADDAESWLRWRLLNRVNDYATETHYERWCEDAAAPFAEFLPSTPKRDALAEHAWKDRSENPGTYVWYLTAAKDWRL